MSAERRATFITLYLELRTYPLEIDGHASIAPDNSVYIYNMHPELPFDLWEAIASHLSVKSIQNLGLVGPLTDAM